MNYSTKEVIKINTVLPEDSKKLKDMLHCDSTECWSGDCLP